MTEPAVAVVGLGCRFPGARDLSEYWENLRGGRCSIVDFSRAELAGAGVDAHQLDDPRYVPAKGYLADADRFEAELFGFTTTEASALDPQHRLLLETAWAALEDAGYDPRRAPERTGVYVGGGVSEHMLSAYADPGLAASLGALQVRILADRDFLATWISYRLGLSGPSMSVQTACSTSLTAIHLATQALLLGECDAALAGGASIDSVHKRGYLYQEGGILSPDGRCRPFDEKAAGTVPGNGAGVVVLRRLADAMADGDPIRAVILGTAVTNDGSAKLGFTAPGVDQQTAAITEAWSAAGLAPSAAQYLETHGTATELGDRVEAAAMRAAFEDKGHCGIGSVKSNLGHLDAAAGVAAFIKTVLMLEHRTLVPTVNVGRPHPDLRLSDSPFWLVDSLTDWSTSAAGGPRLAGVTSLGIGGTNVHAVLTEAPSRPADPEQPDQVELLPLSARSTAQLGAVARRLAGALRAAEPSSLHDVAHTLRTARTPLPVRACVSASTLEEAAERLTAVAEGRAAGDLPPVAQAWVRGEPVTLPAPSRPGRRVHLPTYPFAGEHFGALRPARSYSRPSTKDSDPASAVAGLFRETLGLSDADELDRTYLAAGGDSLMAVHLVGRLRDDLGIDVPIELFLEQLSLRDLVDRVLSTREASDALSSLLDEVESGG
jgi:acyl transferase domain-containing protein/acyl carrier protein